jgi:hypothetical protein
MASKIVQWLAGPASMAVIPLLLIVIKTANSLHALLFIKPTSRKHITSSIYSFVDPDIGNNGKSKSMIASYLYTG